MEESGDLGVMQNSAADQLRGLGQVTPLHWVSGDKPKSYYVHYTAPPTAVANNGLRAAKPGKESPVGLSTLHCTRKQNTSCS